LNGEGGEIVVPAGTPEIVTATELVNPFRPVIVAVKFEVDVPAFAVIAVGDKAMLKSGVELTVNAMVAECARDPDVPFTARL
jgi:hypothetical protein